MIWGLNNFPAQKKPIEVTRTQAQPLKHHIQAYKNGGANA